MVSRLLLLAILAPQAAFVEPQGAFAVALPSGWTHASSELMEGTTYISMHEKGKEEGPHLDFVVQKLPPGLSDAEKEGLPSFLSDTFLTSLGGELSITKQSKSTTTFDGKKGTRVDLEFKDEDGASFKGSLISVAGDKFGVLVMPYAPAGDAAGLKKVNDMAATVAIEKSSPRSGAGGPLSSGALDAIAGRIKQNMKREEAGKVISQGSPPLTYGSVANFVNVIEILFDIQLTEAEFDATRARFVEYYAKADAEGKRILAEQGASLLKTLTSGTPDEREQSRQEGRQVFENAFRNGAQQGIGYAQVMWDAISRRRAKVASAQGQPAKQDWDQEITEGDLDATLEMLYFMWVAAGRDASDVTMDDVAKIRTMIVQQLPQMDPQLQLLIANAPKIYAGIRQQWQAAPPAQRLVMAQQFGAALDEWGIGAQSSFQQSSGGGSGEYSMNAQIAQNTAWNAAKTWSSSN